MNIRQAFGSGRQKLSQPSSKRESVLKKMDLSSQRRNFELDIVYDPDRLNETNLISSKAGTSREGSHLKQSQAKISKQTGDKHMVNSNTEEAGQRHQEHVRNLSESIMKLVSANERYLTGQNSNQLEWNPQQQMGRVPNLGESERGSAYLMQNHAKQSHFNGYQNGDVVVDNQMNQRMSAHVQKGGAYSYSVPEQHWNQFNFSGISGSKQSPKFPKYEQKRSRVKSSNEIGKIVLPGDIDYQRIKYEKRHSSPPEKPIPESIHNSQNLMQHHHPLNPPNSVKNSRNQMPMNYRSQYVLRKSVSNNSNSASEMKQTRSKGNSQVYRKIHSMKQKNFKKIKSQQNSLRKAKRPSGNQTFSGNMHRQKMLKMRRVAAPNGGFQRVSSKHEIDQQLNPEFFMSGKMRDNSNLIYYDSQKRVKNKITQKVKILNTLLK